MTVIQGEVEKEIDELEEMVTESNQDPAPQEEPETASIIVPVDIIKLIRMAPSGEAILSTCIDLAVFLSQKNISYGDSFLNPSRVFSTADRVEQILVRIDDKITRIQNKQSYEGDDDDIKDLLGYLLLYFVVKGDEDAKQRSDTSTGDAG